VKTRPSTASSNTWTAAKQRNQAFTTLFAATETGHYYNEKGLDRTLSRSNPKDSWFYGYIDSGAERLVNIDIDGATGELALFIDYRVEKMASWSAWPAWACA
jgi:methyl-accepting chemotaxis protein